jgi:hypothetical protein
MARSRMGVWLYAVASILCCISAVLPAFRGGRLNLLLLGCGVVFFILAATLRRTPPAA